MKVYRIFWRHSRPLGHEAPSHWALRTCPRSCPTSCFPLHPQRKPQRSFDEMGCPEYKDHQNRLSDELGNAKTFTHKLISYGYIFIWRKWLSAQGGITRGTQLSLKKRINIRSARLQTSFILLNCITSKLKNNFSVFKNFKNVIIKYLVYLTL